MLERNSPAQTPRRARSIANLVDEGPLSRTFLYSAIKEGRLKARKAGRRTVVLDDDYRAFLQALPVIVVPGFDPGFDPGVGGRPDAGN